MPRSILHFCSSSFILSGHTSFCLFRRGRSPQPPAEEEEEDFDENLVAVDTCECQAEQLLCYHIHFFHYSCVLSRFYLTGCIFLSSIQITVTCISRCLETDTVVTRLPSRALRACGQVPELLMVFPKDVYAMK